MYITKIKVSVCVFCPRLKKKSDLYFFTTMVLYQLFCVYVYENMSTSGMNTSLVHPRQSLHQDIVYLVSECHGRVSVRQVLKFRDNSGRNLITSQELLGICHIQTYQCEEKVHDR